MKLLLRQRVFAWFDSYDIYDEDGSVCYTVQVCLRRCAVYRNGDAPGLSLLPTAGLGRNCNYSLCAIR